MTWSDIHLGRADKYERWGKCGSVDGSESKAAGNGEESLARREGLGMLCNSVRSTKKSRITQHFILVEIDDGSSLFLVGMQ